MEAVRIFDPEHQNEARELLGDTYQAVAAMMVKIGEGDSAWIAADRAAYCAELAKSPNGFPFDRDSLGD